MSISILDHKLPYDTHKTYDVIFFGDSIFTTVTSDPSIVDQWISDVNSVADPTRALIIGLDIEWRPSFIRNFQYHAATLQLCVGCRCLIFHLFHAPSIPSSLIDFLSNMMHMFVGLGVKSDLEKLQKDYKFGFNTNAHDLRNLAVLVYGVNNLKDSSLKRLARVVLEKEIDKPKNVTMSNWNYKPLALEQVQYACVDAYVSLEIGRILIDSIPCVNDFTKIKIQN